MSIFEYDEEATLQYIREDEYARGEEAGKKIGVTEGKRLGVAEGKKIGITKGQAESIIILLKEKGDVSEMLYRCITTQKDIAVLQDWLRAASKAESVEEFEKIIKNCKSEV